MAVAVRGSNAVGSGGGTNAGLNVGVDLPAATQVGDLAVAAFMYCDQPADETIIGWAAGWTQQVAVVQVGGTTGQAQVSILWTTVTASTVRPSWSMTNPPADGSVNKAVAGVAVYSGAGTPVFGALGDKGVTSSTTGVATLPTIGAGSHVLGIFLERASSETSVTGPTEETQLQSLTATGGGGATIWLGDEAPAAGTTGTRTATYAVGGTTAAMLVEIPAAASVTAPVPNAGADQTASPGATVTLHGSTTGGVPDTQAWAQTAGTPTVVLSGSGTDRTFVAPTTSTGTTLTFTYTATNTGGTASDSMSVTVGGATGTASVVGATSRQNPGVQTFNILLTGIAGLAAGDTLLAFYEYCDAPSAESISARAGGWDTLVAGHQVSGAFAQVDIIWTTYVPGTTANPSWTMTTPAVGSALNKQIGLLVALRKAGTPTVISSYDRDGAAAGVTSSTVPSGTATAGAVVVGVFCDKVSNETGIAGPGEMTTQVWEINTGGGGGSALLATELRATAGATGPRTWTNDVPSSTGYGALINVPLGASTAAPTADAGVDQTGVEPWTPVLLNGSVLGAADSTGWVQIAGTPTVALTATGTQASFEAPGTLAGTTLTFQFTATNAGGSSTNTMNVTILPATERAVIGGVEVPVKMMNVSST